MVKFTSIALFLIAAVSVQACTYCQCQFANGAHCCVAQDYSLGNIDCVAACKNARRDDGRKYMEGVTMKEGTACGADGKYKCATVFESDNRAKCRLS
ncbi:hypothetical protein NHQ30_004378 [Ciborinia camelliae]|nr:hypothetical protein NHQ30_004378 [Ciborinia camelliae]